MPVLLVVTALVAWATPCARRAYPIAERRAMRTGTIVLFAYLIYPTITSHMFSLWRCTKLRSTSGAYVELNIFVVDPETSCDSTTHLWWKYGLGIPGIVVYVLGLPGAGYVLLRKFRHKLHEPRTRTRLGFLYDGFRPEHYMHELWVAARKVFVILVTTFSDKKLQVLLVMGIIAFFLVHTVLLRPYQTGILTSLDTLLLACCFLTLWMGGVFVVYPNCQDPNDDGRIFCL